MSAALQRLAEKASDPQVRSQNERDNVIQKERVRGAFNGTNQRLECNVVIPGHQLRWFNDYPGRTDRAQSAGWEFVLDGEVELPQSNKPVGGNTDIGSRISAIVGVDDNNNGLRAYLMKIKQEYYDEDQNQLIEKQNDLMRQMVRQGGMNVDRLENAYIPNDAKQALSIKTTRGVANG